MLHHVGTATLTQQLQKRGVRNSWVRGVRSTRPDLRLVGYARTLRYVALREDVRDADTAPLNAQKAAIEAIEPARGPRHRGARGAGRRARSATSSPRACSRAAGPGS